MKYLATAALLCSLTACGAAPDRFGITGGHSWGSFDGTPGAWDDFGMDSDYVEVTFEWDLHTPVSQEVRALRNDMRARAHESSVEEEAEKEKAELIAEAAAKAKEEVAPAGQWDWLYDNVEVWVMLLVGIFGLLWRVGVYFGRLDSTKEEK